MSSSHIPIFLRKLVVKRAKNRCEYCRLSQKGQEATFHIDHIIPVSAGGQTTSENLALACVSCSLRKGARQIYFDKRSKQNISLFDPRKDMWSDHFEWDDVRIKSKSPVGRVTVECLNLIRKLILAIRKEELLAGRSL